MAFTCSEFPGRTFDKVGDLEKLREEKEALRKQLLIQRTSTLVVVGNSEHANRGTR